MNRIIRAICIGGLIVGLGGCAESGNPPCAAELGAPVLVFTLFFGKAIPGRGDLTDREWQSFLDDTVAADLPNGFTVLDANGAWMNPMTRKTIKEATKVVVAALPDVPDSLASINRVRTDYRIKFHQQLVGMTVEHACGAF
jgi:hypothetical protein